MFGFREKGNLPANLAAARYFSKPRVIFSFIADLRRRAVTRIDLDLVAQFHQSLQRNHELTGIPSSQVCSADAKPQKCRQ